MCGVCPPPQSLERELRSLAEEHSELEDRFADMERERDALYESFENTIEVRARACFCAPPAWGTKTCGINASFSWG